MLNRLRFTPGRPGAIERSEQASLEVADEAASAAGGAGGGAGGGAAVAGGTKPGRGLMRAGGVQSVIR